MSVETNPKKGDWDEGYALDIHTISSTHVGDNEYGHPIFATTRSPLGELLYQLKYRADPAATEPIVEAVREFLTKSGWNFELIVPMPSSTGQRKLQPVIEIARGLSRVLNTPLCEKCVLKVKSTPQLKNIYDFSERQRILAGAFAVSKRETAGKRLLLFDDLYRSGATMSAVARVLKGDGGARSVYALALTYTRSNV